MIPAIGRHQDRGELYNSGIMDRSRVELDRVNYWRAGLIFRLASTWIGLHWSAKNRRICFNIIPCVTVYITLPGGDLPNMTDYPCRWAIRK